MYQGTMRCAVVHATEYPCFAKHKTTNKNIVETGFELYLNLFDDENPNKDIQMFVRAIKFIDTHIQDRHVLVHCQAAVSRSPSICLLYLAYKGVITKTSYFDAKREFCEIYSDSCGTFYFPSDGICRFLNLAWDKIMEAVNG